MTIPNRTSIDGSSNEVLKVERPYYEQRQFNSELNYCNPENNGRKVFSQWCHNVKAKNVILSVFPLFSWLSQYNIKNDLVGDIVSGCTVAIMHIPQGKYPKNIDHDKI